MNKVFLLYLLCVSASLLFLSAYFSIAFFDYIQSIFYIISMILLTSTLFLFFISNNQFILIPKLMLISFLFLMMNISMILIKNLFVLSSFAISAFLIFEQFFFIAFGCLICIFAYSLNKPLKQEIFVLLFIPLILFSALLLFFVQQNINGRFFINNFMIFFTTIYSFLVANNFYLAYKDSVELKFKSSMILSGMLLILFFSGLNQAGFFLSINSIIITAGSFLFCFGVLVEKDLSFYSIIFNKIIKSLPSNLRGKYIAWILKISSKMDGLSMIYLKNKSKIIIIDNPSISNNEEIRMYDELLVYSVSWIKRNWKSSAKALKNIKEYYNSQKILTKKLSQFSL